MKILKKKRKLRKKRRREEHRQRVMNAEGMKKRKQVCRGMTNGGRILWVEREEGTAQS